VILVSILLPTQPSRAKRFLSKVRIYFPRILPKFVKLGFRNEQACFCVRGYRAWGRNEAIFTEVRVPSRVLGHFDDIVLIGLNYVKRVKIGPKLPSSQTHRENIEATIEVKDHRASSVIIGLFL